MTLETASYRAGMSAKRDPSLVADARPDLATRVMVVLAWLVTAAMLIVPLAVTPDLLDRFRVIKESIMRAEGIVGLFLIVVAAALGGTVRLREMARERLIVGILLAGLVWTSITTSSSTHLLWSLDSLASVVTSLLVFVTVWYAAPRISLTILDVLVPALLINTAVAAAQEYDIHQPFTVDPLTAHHLTATALIGNPNIVGSYMVLIAVALAGAAVRIRGWRRWLYSIGTICAVSGVFVSRTRTAMIALLVGLAVLAVTLSAKRALALGGVLAILFGAGYCSGVRVIRRVVALPGNVARVGWEVASSGRITPALVAIQMFRDHPLTGVGPGAFRFEYMPYQIEVRRRHGSELRDVGMTNFGETHNDHLQLLAETGLPGYLLFLGGVAILIRTARKSPPGDERREVARAVVLPLAATFLVLCLAQFPLHVAITRHFLMTVAGILAGWSRR
jgi:O-antigen ligase